MSEQQKRTNRAIHAHATVGSYMDHLRQIARLLTVGRYSGKRHA